MVKQERLVVNGEVPQRTPFDFLLVSSKIKDLGLRRIILECDNGPSTESTMCGGGSGSQGGGMANGRVEIVREVKPICRTLLISAEVRIADDSPLPRWLPRLAAQAKNKMRMGKDGNTSELDEYGESL